MDECVSAFGRAQYPAVALYGDAYPVPLQIKNRPGWLGHSILKEGCPDGPSQRHIARDYDRLRGRLALLDPGPLALRPAGTLYFCATGPEECGMRCSRMTATRVPSFQVQLRQLLPHRGGCAATRAEEGLVCIRDAPCFISSVFWLAKSFATTPSVSPTARWPPKAMATGT